MPKKRRPQERPPIDWDFFSFPVVFAFFVGLLVATIIAPFGGFVLQVQFVIALFGVSFCTAHTLTRLWARRRLEKKRNQAGEEERERRALAARAAAARRAAESAAVATNGVEPSLTAAQPASVRRRKRPRSKR